MDELAWSYIHHALRVVLIVTTTPREDATTNRTNQTHHLHTTQELNRVLCDRLEEKMKGTVVDGTVKALFAGQMRPTTRCLTVDYTSSREEEYYDIQLNVKGCV